MTEEELIDDTLFYWKKIGDADVEVYISKFRPEHIARNFVKVTICVTSEKKNFEILFTVEQFEAMFAMVMRGEEYKITKRI